MSRRDPGSGNRDEVAFGPDDPAPSSARLRLLVGVVGVVGLAAGWLVGTQGEVLGWPGGPEASAPSELIALAGAVEKTDRRGEAGPQFDLPVFNQGAQDFTVEKVVFEGLPGSVGDVEAIDVAAGQWGTIAFSAPPDCAQVVPDELPSVRLTVRGASGPATERTMPLPHGGRMLVDYLHLLCAPQVVPDPDELVGLWVVEEAYPANWEGAMLWRFEPDGSFSADPEGAMSRGVEDGVEGGVQGHYQVRRGRLVIDVDDGYGCAKGDRAVWRPSLLEGVRPSVAEDSPHFTVSWVSGSCPDDARGELWVLRRILAGAD